MPTEATRLSDNDDVAAWVQFLAHESLLYGVVLVHSEADPLDNPGPGEPPYVNYRSPRPSSANPDLLAEREGFVKRSLRLGSWMSLGPDESGSRGSGRSGVQGGN